MTTRRLQHCSSNETRYFRIVRNRRRMLKLKRRGVRFVTSIRDGRKVWLWFVRDANPTRWCSQFLKARRLQHARRWAATRERLRSNALFISPISPLFLNAIRAAGRSTLPRYEDEVATFLQPERPLGIDYASIEARVMAHGYAVEVAPATPEQRAKRYSPIVDLLYAGLITRDEARAKLVWDGPPAGQGGPANGYPCTQAEFAFVPTSYEACAFCGTPLRTNESERTYCPHCNR